MEIIKQIDTDIILFINQYFNIEWIKSILAFITQLGNGGFIWIVLGIILTFCKKTSVYGRTMLISLIIGFIIGNVILKPFFDRPRPFQVMEFINIIIPLPMGASFPSGHSLGSFAAAFSLYNAPKKYFIPVLILAIIIGASRVFLMVHYPSDVLVGALIGSGIGFILSKITKLKHKNYRY